MRLKHGPILVTVYLAMSLNNKTLKNEIETKLVLLYCRSSYRSQ